MKKIFSYVIAAMMVLSLVGGNGITVSAKTKKKPKMSASKITMTVGQKKTLKLKNYSKISKKKIKKVKWKTSDKKVVTVKASGKYRQQGKVTAKKIGKATISLKYNGKTYKCKVIVKSTGKKVTEQKTTEDKKTTTEQKTEQRTTNEKTDEPVVEKPACNHKWDAGIIKKAATCTEDGVIVYTCAKCGESNTETLEKSGHVWGTVYITDVEATTENEGSKSLHCTICDTINPDSVQIVEKLTHNHVWDAGTVTKEPDCEQTGIRMYLCSLCGEEKKESIPALGHTQGTTWVADREATCKQEGSRSIHCTVCDKIIPETVTSIMKLEHTFDNGYITKEATCGEDGVRTYTCTMCGDTKGSAIAKTGNHNYDTGVLTKSPTCAEEGIRTYTCTVCADTKTEAVSKTEEHIYNSGIITREATCEHEGIKTFTCIICGKTRTETIPILTTHTYDDTYTVDVESTYSTQGRKSHHCTGCGRTDGKYVDMDFADTYSRYTDTVVNVEAWGPANTYYLGGIPDGMGSIVVAYMHDNEYYTVSLGNYPSKNFTVEIRKGDAQLSSRPLQKLSFSYDEAVEIYKKYDNDYMSSHCYEYWKNGLTAERSLVIDSDGIFDQNRRLFVSEELLYKILWESDYKPDYNIGFRNLNSVFEDSKTISYSVY